MYRADEAVTDLNGVTYKNLEEYVRIWNEENPFLKKDLALIQLRLAKGWTLSAAMTVEPPSANQSER